MSKPRVNRAINLFLKQLLKLLGRIFKQIRQLARANAKGPGSWLLRRLLKLGRSNRQSRRRSRREPISQSRRRSRRQPYSQSRRRSRQMAGGFVLPTVTMIILIVILVVSAITIRSFDRANNAQLIRASEESISAAKPALDRANAKIAFLLNEDPTIPRETPSDFALYNAMTTGNTYTFGDEVRLSVRYDIDDTNRDDNQSSIDTDGPDGNPNTLEDNEAITTAWRFPVDTDNNGLFDSFTLYGIYFRSPSRANTGQFNRQRLPLDVRTPPMPPTQLNNAQCAGALTTSANLVGAASWFQTQGVLQKSFYIFTATVPITNLNDVLGPAETDTDFETRNSSTFSALEYQQDRSRVPLVNNAVVYEDDLEIASGATLRLNGRMVTNSNFIVTHFGGGVELFQVSGLNSCYYNEQNAKIIVGGNVVNGWTSDNNFQNPVTIHLYDPTATDDAGGNAPTAQVTNGNESVSQNPLDVIYNNNAYAQRINLLVTAQVANTPRENFDPTAVTLAVNSRLQRENLASGDNPTREAQIRQEELDSYFRDRTRRVPYNEIGDGDNAVGTFTVNNVLQGAGDSLRPPDDWMLPTNGDGQIAGPTGLTINAGQLQATEPQVQSVLGREQFLGDRILVGNNLPTLRWNGTQFVGEDTAQQIDGNTNWDDPPAPNQILRTRTTRVSPLANAGDTGRFGFWEQNAGQEPQRALDGVGGLRVVTGAGVYERLTSFLPPPADLNTNTAQIDYDDPATPGIEETYPIVWPDTMPMSPGQGSQVFNNDPAAPAPVPPATLWGDPTTNRTLTTPIAGSIDPNTNQYEKGDLRMRATAVYHYAADPYDPDNGDTDQAPIACISSYYDPTNSVTAQNMDGLPWNAVAEGKSNNGIFYPPPVTARPTPGSIALNPATNQLTSGALPNLANQANLVFPNGRFVNLPLRNALITLANNNDLNLAEQSAVDSTLCALDILNAGGFDPINAPVDHGAIREVSFLDARQIKAIDADNTNNGVDETFTLSSSLANPAQLSGNYDLDLAERQPLEIRATQLDLDELRITGINIAGGGRAAPAPEYLLPNSGIIYATRDDALPDRSSRPANAAGDDVDENASALLSPTDSRIDPTRRPNGILLVNGDRLARNDSNNDGQNDTAPPLTITQIVQEKGLILASDLPVYIKGRFNFHDQEEFTDLLEDNWSDFYTRAQNTLNPNFACRVNDPRLPNCTNGDNWRPATVLADAVTLLSDNFRFGFRNEGDFDLRNNAGNPLIIGYDLDGSGTIDAAAPPITETGVDLNGDGATGAATEDQITVAGARSINGFYANNFATNGLSNGQFDADTDGTYDATFTDASYNNNNNNNPNNPLNSSYFNNFVTPVQRRGSFPEYVMEICRKLPVSACEPDDWVVGYDFANDGNEFSDQAPANIDANQDGTPNTDDVEGNIKAYQIVAAISVNGGTFQPTRLLAGTTALPPKNPQDQRYPRRVAFLRWPKTGAAHTLVLSSTTAGVSFIGAGSNNLVVENDGTNQRPIPLGIAGTDNSADPNAGTPAMTYYPTYGNVTVDLQDGGTTSVGTTPAPYPIYGSANRPRLQTNALWFKTDNNGTNDWGYNYPLFYLNTTVTGGTVQQPLLVPVLQIHNTTGAPAPTMNAFPNPQNGNTRRFLRNRTRWQPRAQDTIFNLVVGSGDTPSRKIAAASGDYNGGMQNLPRLLENWRINNNNFFATTIFGSFIQLGRSSYATGPYQPILPIDPAAALPPAPITVGPGVTNRFLYGNLFNYPQAYNATLGSGKTPFFNGSNRNWGFDVGLLSQPPDLFAQTFTLPPANNSPNEYFREVSRDDDWIQTLLCARLTDNTTNAVPTAQRPTGFCTSNTGG